MRVNWEKFDGVEAQVFQPVAGTRSVILFCPGFPGMGGTVFEQRHAAALVAEGYAVYVIKHKGTKLSGAVAPVLVNNAARLMEGRKADEKFIGGDAATIEDWLEEPLKALEVLHAAYDSIHVIGNSFGALAALWSMTQEDAPISKVKSLLLYAGAQGVDDGTEDGIMRVWQPEFLMASRITDKVALNDPFDIVARLGKTYRSLPERVKALPEQIAITYLVVDRDEILRLSDTEAFKAAIGGRGKIVIDKVDHAWPEHNLLAHDTPNYTTEDLLGLIRG
jgi:pimeloyl-ACP methyl ester carboxylesterase